MTGWTGFAVLAGCGLLFVVALQAITCAIGWRIGRFNVVDVSWGLGFIGIAWLSLALGGGDPIRRWILAVGVSIWGLRLAWHMTVKSKGHGEDPRYVDLLSRTGGYGPDGPRLTVVVRRVFAIQGLAQWFVSIPVMVSAVAGPTSGLAWIVAAIGIALYVLGLLFEAIGDAQLRAFKADPTNRGRIMDRGLWAWTRHPNYFGDASVWWGIWLFTASAGAMTTGTSVIGAPGLLSVLSPVAMTYFLVYATGARLLEESMASRPGYREYQERTSYFLPRPPRTPEVR
ncbi:DUF1295 domain-containing protein [Gordonia sp. NB41Y]|uniref:DUF1295 domain-containing protein n=1 Tax=Gordonia sp. NB41Y TaxID=875808 RepID=UPI0006B153B4|nr:DUF1295 domain-containing protein [Gordonia sp. NB41Y]KOY49721.1 membrane protein [Gordonia sp. NB41Y]WLP92822.1 DUF1295 domain-containing protein [Gordonia sp. NB41Y]